MYFFFLKLNFTFHYSEANNPERVQTLFGFERNKKPLFLVASLFLLIQFINHPRFHFPFRNLLVNGDF
jgi:hypothetical protein